VTESAREPHPSRLDPHHPARAAILAAHTEAVAAERDGYLDPVTGYFVFTAAHLANTGSCCNSGCRHCPFID
jgi:Family of unknown function (DUF5522)